MKLNHSFSCSNTDSFISSTKQFFGANDTAVRKYTLPFGAYILVKKPDLYHVLESLLKKAKIKHFPLLLFTYN